MVVSFLTWVLGNKLRSSGRASGVLNCYAALLPAPWAKVSSQGSFASESICISFMVRVTKANEMVLHLPLSSAPDWNSIYPHNCLWIGQRFFYTTLTPGQCCPFTKLSCILLFPCLHDKDDSKHTDQTTPT